MHLYLAEVAPAAPAVIEAVPPLLALTGLFIALGLVTMLDGFLRGLFSALQTVSSWIPFGGSITASILHRAEQAISHALGVAISGIERAIGHQWHNLARVLHHLWYVIEETARVGWAVAQIVSGLNPAAGLRTLRNIATQLLHRVGVLEHAVHTITHTVTQTIVHHIPRRLVRRLHAVEHAIAQTIPREIKYARDLAREAEDGVARLWNRVKAIEQSVSDTAIAAAVATALAALGLDWLGCRDGAGRAGRTGCDLWDDIGSLLGLAALAITIEDFDTLVHEAQDLTGEVVTGLHELWNL